MSGLCVRVVLVKVTVIIILNFSLIFKKFKL